MLEVISLLIGAIGLLLTAIGTILTIRSQNKKTLEYDITSTPLVTDEMSSIPGLKITMNGSPIKSLISSQIIIRNVGKQDITPSDFASLEPLGAVVTGKFFTMEQGYQIISDNKNFDPSITFLDDTCVKIGFDYLSPKKAISVTLLHNGKLSIKGELKSGKLQSQYTRIKKMRIMKILFDILSNIIAVIIGLFLASKVL